MGRRFSCCICNRLCGRFLVFLAMIFSQRFIGIGYAALSCYDQIRKAFTLGLSTVDGVRI